MIRINKPETPKDYQVKPGQTYKLTKPLKFRGAFSCSIYGSYKINSVPFNMPKLECQAQQEYIIEPNQKEPIFLTFTRINPDYEYLEEHQINIPKPEPTEMESPEEIMFREMLHKYGLMEKMRLPEKLENVNEQDQEYIETDDDTDFDIPIDEPLQHPEDIPQNVVEINEIQERTEEVSSHEPEENETETDTVRIENTEENVQGLAKEAETR